MSDFDNCANDFNLDADYIKNATESLIREYLARKGLRKSLEVFDEEVERDKNSLSISNRTKLIEYLCIHKLYEQNKLKRSYQSNTDMNPMNNYKFKTNNKSKLNDLQIDDTNEGELYDGNDKRIEKKNLDEKDSFDLNLKINKLRKDIKGTDKKANFKDKDDDFPINKGKSYSSNKPQSNDIFNLNDSKTTGKQLLKDRNDGFDEEFKKKLEEKADKLRNFNIKNEFDNQIDQFSHRSSSNDYNLNECNNREKIESSDYKKEKTSLNLNKQSTQFKSSSLSKKNENEPHNLKSDEPGSNEYTVSNIDYETAKELRTLLFGNILQSFPEEWKTQSFSFCDFSKLKFGISQKKGGPCGVLASVQAYVLKELIFDNGEVVKDTNLIFNPNKKDRSLALARGLTNLLIKCSLESKKIIIASLSPQAHFAPVGKYKSDGITERLKLLTFNNVKSLENFLIKNIHLFENEGTNGCILLLYSAIFTRSIKQIQIEMDDPSNRLMGKHDYCTQEMVNLLCHGRAVSNVFNDTVFLDSLELKGLNKRNDIGLLSLFEHYKSCEVGSYYKTPKYPIWVVCSESHFSVLFAIRKDILSDWKAETRFDLFYYDGLAKQDEQIKLTISSKSNYDDDDSFMSSLYKNKKADKDKDLTPPLELVIRTKWKDASINWNNTSPIL